MTTHNDLVLLDGGMGHLLKQQYPGVADLGFLGSNLACSDFPAGVIAAHREYIESGSSVITTNNFISTPHHFAKLKEKRDCLQVVVDACKCATAAAEQHTNVRVAGSMPPLKESYAVLDPLPEADMLDIYGQIAGCLAEHCDILLCETMSSTTEAQCAIRAAARVGRPVWVSFTLHDDASAQLRSGESIEDAVDAALEAGPVQAVLVNCCAPAAVSACMPKLAARCRERGILCGAYANGFKTPTSQWLSGSCQPALPIIAEDFDAEDMIHEEAYARYARQWLEDGASIIGGCCGIGPAHIRALASLRPQSM